MILYAVLVRMICCEVDFSVFEEDIMRIVAAQKGLSTWSKKAPHYVGP